MLCNYVPLSNDSLYLLYNSGIEQDVEIKEQQKVQHVEMLCVSGEQVKN